MAHTQPSSYMPAAERPQIFYRNRADRIKLSAPHKKQSLRWITNALINSGYLGSKNAIGKHFAHAPEESRKVVLGSLLTLAEMFPAAFPDSPIVGIEVDTDRFHPNHVLEFHDNRLFIKESRMSLPPNPPKRRTLAALIAPPVKHPDPHVTLTTRLEADVAQLFARKLLSGLPISRRREIEECVAYVTQRRLAAFPWANLWESMSLADQENASHITLASDTDAALVQAFAAYVDGMHTPYTIAVWSLLKETYGPEAEPPQRSKEAEIYHARLGTRLRNTPNYDPTLFPTQIGPNAIGLQAVSGFDTDPVAPNHTVYFEIEGCFYAYIPDANANPVILDLSKSFTFGRISTYEFRLERPLVIAERAPIGFDNHAANRPLRSYRFDGVVPAPGFSFLSPNKPPKLEELVSEAVHVPQDSRQFRASLHPLKDDAAYEARCSTDLVERITYEIDELAATVLEPSELDANALQRAGDVTRQVFLDDIDDIYSMAPMVWQLREKATLESMRNKPTIGTVKNLFPHPPTIVVQTEHATLIADQSKINRDGTIEVSMLYGALDSGQFLLTTTIDEIFAIAQGDPVTLLDKREQTIRKFGDAQSVHFISHSPIPTLLRRQRLEMALIIKGVLNKREFSEGVHSNAQATSAIEARTARDSVSAASPSSPKLPRRPNSPSSPAHAQAL